VSSAIAQAAGALLVALVMIRAGMMLASAMRRFSFEKEQRRLGLELLRQRVEAAMAQKAAARDVAERSWTGYRKFEVARKVSEASNVVSLYLVPHNRKPLPLFKPGQYLTFRFQMPDRSRPLIRCYSLSDAPDGDQYRITVKRIASPPDKPETPPGLASSYLHDAVSVGDILDVMAPTGHFFLDETTDRPVVLMGGGIGLTPLLSMLNAIVRSGRNREIWLFYVVHNRSEEVMGGHLREIAVNYPNVRLRISHTAAASDETEGKDYDYAERLTVKMVESALPSSNFDFYVCGPSAMMSDMIAGLRAWEVPEEHIHYEAFGAASVQQVMAGADSERARTDVSLPVTFVRTGKTATWRPEIGTILDLAEHSGVIIEYGCRAGNCGTCLTAVRSGEVAYLGEPGAAAESGTCLTCIGVPKTALVLDA
jgi:ferredoxin-NADP reductase